MSETREWHKGYEIGYSEGSKKTWIEQLEQARSTLLVLRGSIRGNSPSQAKMSGTLRDAINIVSTQITVEEVLAR